jgi:hypothetical protein
MSVFPDLVDEEEDEQDVKDMHRLAQLIATYVCIANEQAAERMFEQYKELEHEEYINDIETLLYDSLMLNTLLTRNAYKDIRESYVSVLREMGVKGV